MDFELFARAFGALFALMNPFVTLPVLLSLTQGQAPAEVRRVGLVATFYAAVVCAVVVVAGQPLLSLFGITVDDLRVAGGLVLFLLGLGMVTGTSASTTSTTGSGGRGDGASDIAFYPLTFPMIVGPGTIATILIFSTQADDIAKYTAVAGALVATLAITGSVLFFATNIGRHLSQKLRVVLSRIMGLILAAIAAELVTSGLKSLLPGLA